MFQVHIYKIVGVVSQKVRSKITAAVAPQLIDVAPESTPTSECAPDCCTVNLWNVENIGSDRPPLTFMHNAPWFHAFHEDVSYSTP